ncbi:MAG: hypothetical protein ACR2FJ_06330 [Qipengyuania sp.]
MTLPICARALAAALALCSAAPAVAQDEEQVTDRDPTIADIVTTPISDLNLRKDPIPPVLLEAVRATYDSEALNDCDALMREVARLDAVLGPDLDQQNEERRDITMGKVAQRALASFIPFRSVIREVSGAADHERDFREAIVAGAVRRGYLKGLGEQRDCAWPARPAEVLVSVRGDVVTDLETGDTVERQEDGRTVTFRRKEVVQGE